jgi:crotonobetainyl-CoA:carnitine CoA-transferase CaiB-like acyl-CoA transferase
MKMLEGIRVVDMTSVVFGPYATQALADSGADVIKVEPQSGDVSRLLARARNTKTNGGTHLTINRGKRSITLDLKLEADAEILRNLIETADVFIHNVRDKAINKLGFDYESVKAIKSDIIYVHCSGFGQNGPYRDLQAYDDVIQAASGTCTLSSRVDGNPQPRYIPSLIADKISGLFGTQAVLTAVIHKLRTGEGQRVEVPMFEAFTSFMLEEHLSNATFLPPLGPIGYARQLEPFRQPFETADGYISIVPYTDDKIVSLFDLLDAPAWLVDAGFDTPLARFKNMNAIYRQIGILTKNRTNQAWMEIFHKTQFPAMPVRDLEDIFEDPHLKATGFFKTREHPTEGQFREMQPPIRYGADPDRVLGFAPSLGEHNEEIRQELRKMGEAT